MMTIQINTDKNIKGSEGFITSSKDLINAQLERYTELISRVEVHFSDEDGSKDGLNTKRCLIEARLEGKQPIAVKNQADTNHMALSGALDKLNASLNTIVGRMKNH
jgi:ribosome-associated translation inhibitor RaiA